MSFKTKVRKKTNNDIRVTLDAKHKEKVSYFENLNKDLPNKIKQLDNIKNKYNQLKKIRNKDLSDIQFNEKIELEDNIKDLEKEINQIKNKDKDIDYLLETGHLLFSYYNNSNEIAEGKINSYNNLKQPIDDKKTVMDYFSNKKNNEKKKK